MKIRRKIFVGLVILLVLFSLVLASCKPQEEEPEVFVPQGEEATYFCDGPSGENTIVLKNGKFTLSIGSDNKNGSYKYTKDTKELALTYADGSTGTAELDLTKGTLNIRYGGAPYVFIVRTSFTVTFETNGGSAVASTEVLNGRTLSRPSDTEKDGYVFAGWYKDASFNTAFVFNSDKITANTTLYAKFVEQTDGKGEFAVQLVNGTQVVETRITNNGILYNLPELKESGKVFLGWWMSDSYTAEKLTRQYFDTEKIQENTTLYAVWEGDMPAISVTSTKVSWTGEAGVRYTYTVQATEEDGTLVVSSATETTSFDVDFASQPAGEYVVTITSPSGKTAKAYFNNKTLARVSLFEVSGNDLTFNKVANATDYLITVHCGDPTHNHVAESLNGSSTYNFANCQISEEGYKFTVTAVAEGYVSSVSETFTYDRKLNAITNVKHNENEGTVTWDKVEGATSYVVSITVNGQTTEETVYTESVSVSSYRGDVKVEVKAVAFGYRAEASTITYTNNRLAAPTNIKVNMSTITWDKVEGAVKYVVKIDNREFEVTTESFTMDEKYFVAGQVEYRISIKAVASNAADNSFYSEEFVANYGVMGSTIAYANNVLSWDAVFGAARYVVTINAGEETEQQIIVDDGSISTRIVWRRAGDNTVSVYSEDKDGVKSTSVSLVVKTYVIYLEAGENAVAVEPVYYAIGDEYELPEAQSAGLVFRGWYDRADYQNGRQYETKGVMTADMDGLTIYAGWTKEVYTITLDVAEGGSFAEGTATTVEVSYGDTYTLPVPTSNDTNKAFAGWYTEPRGAGRQYANNAGISNGTYPQAANRTLYAYYVEIFSFQVVYNDVTQAYDSVAVYAGPGISYVTEIIIPSTYYATLEYYEWVEDESGNQTQRFMSDTRLWKVTQLAPNAFDGAAIVKVSIPNTIKVLPDAGSGGYYEGSAFKNCAKLTTVVVYDVNDPTREVGMSDDTLYWSQDGVLYIKDATSGDIELVYYPYAKADAIYVMPYGVTNIPQYSLRGAKFVEVYIPASVRKINKSVFYSCSNLTTIVFMEPEEGQVASTALDLAYGATTEAAIYSCSKLTSITFPLRLKTFEPDSIVSCSKLTTILIGADGAMGDTYSSIAFKDDNGTIVGSIVTNRAKTELIYVPRGYEGEITYDTDGTTVLKKTLYIPSGIQIIGADSMGGSSSTYACKFTEVYIPGTVTTIGENAFKYCTAMTNVVFQGQADDPDLTIKTFAFYYCSGLTEITLPANLTTIESYAFASTSKLTTVYVNADRPYVDYQDGAFSTQGTAGAGTYYITTIYLGPTVPEIAITAVFGDMKLESINVDSQNPFYKTSEDGVLFNRAETRILYFPMAKGGSYTIPSTVKEIEPGTFSNRLNLTEIVIHAGVTRIGEYAFDNCDGLTSVVFLPTAEGATPVDLTIAELAFYDVDYVETITIPARTVEIGPRAFYSASRLYDFKFEPTPAGQEERPLVIGRYSLAYLGTTAVDGKYLTSITLPERTVEIGDLAFYYCQYLRTINLPKNVSKMGQYVTQKVTVYGVDANGQPTVQQDVERDVLISMSVFYGCYRLESINVDPANKYYSSIDGVLYSKEFTPADITNYIPWTENTMATIYNTITEPVLYDNTDGAEKVLLVCPGGNSGVNGKLVIPNTIMMMWFNAFYYNGYSTYHPDGVGVKEISFSKPYIENQRKNTLEVAEQVFYYARALESIDFPTGLTAIRNRMFYYCDNLTSLQIPYTVEYFEQYAFYYCQKLTSITFEETPEGEEVTDLVFEIGSSSTAGVFYYANALTSISLPERTTEIHKWAFAGSKFVSIELPSTLQLIDTYAFNNLQTLESLTFPNGIKSTTSVDGSLVGLQIYDYAFYGCSKLKSINLPEGVTDIGYYAFYGCSGLESASLPSTLSNLGNMYSSTSSTLTGKVFYSLRNLKTVTFAPNCVLTAIPEQCFYNCVSLTSIEIPGRVEVIGAKAFYGCRALASITFATDAEGKNHLYSIGSQAFATTAITSFVFPESEAESIELATELFKGCEYLTDVHLSSNISIIAGVFRGCDTVTNMTVSEDNVNFKAYKTKDGSTLPILVSKNDTSIKFVYGNLKGTFAIPEGFESIEESAFKDQVELEVLVIPTSLNIIGNFAFSGCTALKEVRFNGVSLLTQIGNQAFEKTVSLQSFTFPSNAELTIGEKAFLGSGVKSITFGNQIASIGNYAFSGTTNLTSVTIPNNSALVLGNYVFSESGLVSINFAGEVGGVGTYLLAGCVNLTTYNFPSNATAIPVGTFVGCTAITSFTIPAAITTLGNYAFGNSSYGGAGITQITIPATVTAIGTYLFSHCEQLTKVTFEENESIKALGNYMFEYCTALESIDLSPLTKLNFLGTYTFRYSGLKTFTVPENVKSLNNTATASSCGSTYLFYMCENLETVYMHDDIKYFGDYLFYGCANLKSIICRDHSQDEVPFVGAETPASLLKIGQNAFTGCGSLEKLDMSASADLNEIETYAFGYSSNTITDGVQEIVIPGKVKTIGTYTFRYNNGLKKVTFLENSVLTALPDYMFAYCENLKEFNLEALTALKYLGTYCFSYCYSIEEVRLPDNVKTLAGSTASPSYSSSGYAFRSCTSLKKVDLNNCTKLGAYSFAYCSSLETVIGLEKVEVMAYYAFAYCGAKVENPDGTITTTGLKSVTFGANMKTWGYGLFTECFNLEEVVIEKGSSGVIGYNNLTSSTYTLFKNCDKLKKITLPDNVTQLPGGAFMGCSALTDINITDCKKLVKIGAYAFQNCSSLTSMDLSGLPLDEIRTYTFEGCSGLTKLVFPNGIKAIGNNATYKCYYVDSISIPASVTTIGSNNWIALKNASSVTIPAGVTSIGNASFTGISQLTAFTVAAGNTAFRVGSYGELIEITDGTDPDILRAMPGAATGKYVFGEDVVLGAYSFINTPGITEIELAPGTTEIPAYGFAYAKFSEFEIPASVTTIGYYGFAYTYNLKEITIPDTVKKLGQYAFKESGVETVYYNATEAVCITSAGATTEAGYLFSYTHNLKNMVIAEGVTDLPTYFIHYLQNGNVNVHLPESLVAADATYLMYYCSNTAISVNIPNSWTEIPNYFCYFSATSDANKLLRNHLVDFKLSQNIKKIGNYAFGGLIFDSWDWNNAPIEDIGASAFYSSAFADGYVMEIPNTVKKMGYNAFGYADVEKVILPASLQEIYYTTTSTYNYEYIFYYADIGTVEFAEGTTTVGFKANGTSYGMFRYATIGEIIIPNTVTTIWDYTFAYCTTEILVIPASVTYIGQYAFYYADISELYILSESLDYIGNYVFYWVAATSATATRFPGIDTVYFAMSKLDVDTVYDDCGTTNNAPDDTTFIYNFDGEVPEVEVTWPKVEEDDDGSGSGHGGGGGAIPIDPINPRPII